MSSRALLVVKRNFVTIAFDGECVSERFDTDKPLVHQEWLDDGAAICSSGGDLMRVIFRVLRIASSALELDTAGLRASSTSKANHVRLADSGVGFTIRAGNFDPRCNRWPLPYLAASPGHAPVV